MPISILPQDTGGQELYNAAISSFFGFTVSERCSANVMSRRKKDHWTGYLQVQVVQCLLGPQNIHAVEDRFFRYLRQDQFC